MAKKRRTFGKTTKQWDNLYNKLKRELKGEHGVTRLTKTEFKEVWTKRPKGTTINDIARALRKEDEFKQYERKYSRLEKQGYGISNKLSETKFKQQLEEYKNLDELVEAHLFVSRKQAKNWKEHLEKMRNKYEEELEELGILDLNERDFLKSGEKHDLFWDFIDRHGGWNEVFEYGA